MYFIVVNRHRVQSNRKNGTDEPVFRISNGKYGKPTYGHAVHFEDGFLFEDKVNPLPCGATVWLEAVKVDVVP